MQAITITDATSIGLGLLSCALSIGLYLKGRRTRRLTFLVRSFPLIADRLALLSGLDIRFRGQRFRNLSASKVLIENTGSEVLHPSDFATAAPLTLVLADPNATFLAAKVVGQSREANQAVVASCDKSQSSRILQFDYFGPSEGCVLVLLHTSSDPSGLLVQGTIKGGTLKCSSAPRKLIPGGGINQNLAARRLNIVGMTAVAVALLGRLLVPSIVGSVTSIGLIALAVMLSVSAALLYLLTNQHSLSESNLLASFEGDLLPVDI